MKIAVVDCDKSAVAAVMRYINRYAAENNIAMTIKIFTAAEHFLFQDILFDIVFMGADLSNRGMENAARLRAKDHAVSIILISQSDRFALSGYSVNAEAYLLRPLNYSGICAALKKSINAFSKRKCCCINQRMSNGCRRFSVDSLIYVEIFCHRLVYHFQDNAAEGRGTLAEVEKELAPYNFMRSGHSFLINPRYVNCIKGYDLYIENDILRISRNKRSRFLTQLCDWVKTR